LKAAMLDIVGSGVIDDLLPKPEPFPEIAPKQCRSDYFDLGETLATTEHGWVDETYNMSVPSGPKLYMRIIPHALEGDLTSTAALKLAQSGQLEPMRSKHQIGGIGFDRNKYGAIAFTGGDRNIVALAQLHKNKEIWGIDTVLQRIKGIVHHGFEEIFQSMLPTYLRFAHETLKLSFPITAEVGITGIEGFKIEAPPGMGFGGYERHGGKFTESEVFKRFVVESQDIDSEEVLQPFFETVWEEAGQTSRPTMPK
ncbi:MAG TPA: hypothetical protein VKA94_11365, partial [Hyphomicrobiales bacterium]|nr:hypothetical protein [Hyphomicrobiales bacterium]